MSKSVQTRVHWIPPEEGGRLALPSGKRYATISRFAEDADSWMQEAWSVLLEFDESPVEWHTPCLARARFLVEEAPTDRLQPGRTFELYEGSKKVAVVEVVR